MTQTNRDLLTVASERAVLVACLLPGHQADPHDPLGELRSLAESAGAMVVDQMIQNRLRPDPRTFIGSGKVDALTQMVQHACVDVIIFDNDLSPSQIGNIEKATQCKVLDRSELILDIFATRAKTYEAKLQVELAQLEYTYPRLRAMWSHLERIAGGAPTGMGTRGPGEQQLEIDRRMVQRKKAELKREITAIQSRKHREVTRRNQDHFTVGLVGYTNAGKSTLFNALTHDNTYANDKLFATLSTRTRKWHLGAGDTAMLSDTVGFVRDLPHHLVASFKATLEEAVHSDLLLVVLDVSHPRAHHQLETVTAVLDDIGATNQTRLLVLNKIDLLEHNGPLVVFERLHPGCVVLSAATGSGVDRLTSRIRQARQGDKRQMTLTVSLPAGKAVHFIETRTEVLERCYKDQEVVFTVRIGHRQLDPLRAMGVTVEPSPKQESPTPPTPL